MKTRMRILAAVLCIALLVLPAQAAQDTTLTRSGLSALGGRAGTLLSSGADFPAGTSVCDWTAMALAISGSREDYSSYLQQLEIYVEECYRRDGGLDPVKATTSHRIALTVMALGGDPESFGEKPDGTPVNLICDGTYGFAGESLGLQGLNGWIYALITLDAWGGSVPENAKFSREDMLSAIVNAQESDGGFGLTAGASGVDITAMALQALAPYREMYPEVIEAGISYLSCAMDENCLYAAYGEESAESSAQVILALCALGIDPETDSRFARGSENVLSALGHFRLQDHTYGHTPSDTQGNFLATAQTLLALTAAERLRSGENGIFDFTDYVRPPRKRNGGVWYAAAALCAAGAVCAIIAGKRRKYGRNHG